MHFDMNTMVLANFIIVVGSILQMATGVSVGMLIVPFLAMISYTLVPLPVVLASLVLTMMMAYRGRAHIDYANANSVSIGMIAGIFLAVFIFSHLYSDYLGVLFGVLILLSVGISVKIDAFTLSKKMTYLGGLVAGTMGALAAVGGQVLALLFQNHSHESIKATLAMLYTIFSIAMLIIFFLFDHFSVAQLNAGVMMMPGFLIGYLVAPFFVRYFHPQYAKVAVLAMATIGSVLLIAQSLVKVMA